MGIKGLEPDRLYTEVEAAEVLGIKPRSLRTERIHGKIGYKRVASKIMYRGRDLIDWLNDGEPPWHAEAKDRGSYSSLPGIATTSDGPKPDVHASARQARQISAKLKKRTPTSCASADNSKGRVTRLAFR